MKRIIKELTILLVLLSAVSVQAQTYKGEGTSYYTDYFDLSHAKNMALYYATADAVINSGLWYIKDINGFTVHYASLMKKNKLYYLCDAQDDHCELLSMEVLCNRFPIVEGPIFRYARTGSSKYVTAEAVVAVVGKGSPVPLPGTKMRSYVGVGSIGYCWNLYPEIVNGMNNYMQINNNGIYATLGIFKFGSKYFAFTLDLLSFDQNIHSWTSYSNTGNPNGENSLDSSLTKSGDYILKLEELSLIKIGWQYDLHLYRYNYRHFSPYKFVLSPFIAVTPVKVTFVKLPFPYYSYNGNYYEKYNAGELTTLFDYFNTFEAGIKLKSSLYELTIGYNWRYGKNDFIQNYTYGEYGPDSKLSIKSLNMEHGFFFVKLGICFTWYTKNFQDL